MTGATVSQLRAKFLEDLQRLGGLLGSGSPDGRGSDPRKPEWTIGPRTSTTEGSERWGEAPATGARPCRARILSCLAAAAALCAFPGQARAQAEHSAADVLLLLDTSGSMAYTTVRDPNDPSKYALPRCGDNHQARFPDSGGVSFESDATFAAGSPSPADRWSILANAFTGTIVGPQCGAQDRSTTEFQQEFALGGDPATGTAPYDRGYYLPVHRIIASQGSARCTPAPSWDDTLRSTFYGSAGNALDWPDGTAPVYWRDVDAPFYPGTPCPETFTPQAKDGIIDRLQASVRFGLMTFDPSPYYTNESGTPSIGTGVSGLHPDYGPGVGDVWSYFPGWLDYPGSGSPMTGRPAGCESKDPSEVWWFELGARNAAAPPWEGRLISFGNPSDKAGNLDHNRRVQQAILAARPFGGTPIAGMLADAYEFLVNDQTEPSAVGGAQFYGGAVDTSVSKVRGVPGCRRRVAILITDGGPNLDLQPHCHPEPTDDPPGDGKCPYNPKDVVDEDLFANVDKAPFAKGWAQVLYDSNIDLFVVGFAVSARNDIGTTLTCEDLMGPGPDHRDCNTLAQCTKSDCPVNPCAYGYCITSPADELLAACCNLKSIANAGSRCTAVEAGCATVGEPRDPYWAQSKADLLAAVTNILRFPPSSMTRTQPTFAASSATVGSEHSAGMRFYSSYEPENKQLYSGHFRRERWVCDARLFSVKLADGSELASAALCPAGQATLERITPRPTATRLAERSAGWRATLELATADGRTRIRWQAVLRDGSNYVRQEVALLAHAGPRPVEFGLLDLPAGDARSCGAVVGSPLVSGNFFLGCEHPLAKNQVAAGRAVCRLPLYDSPAAGMAEASAAVGVAPAGQLRRGFLYYLDRERARPYRPFTYYISWFDIAAPGLKMNQSQCVEVIEAFGSELARKRGVKLDAFVFDDGWDDNQSLWDFHAGFPHGFTPLGERAARYNAILGTWISPFGGYGEHKQERLAFGRSRGYETNRSGFALSGPKYFEAFGKVCEEMIRRYGIGYLKFDGIGGGSDDGPGTEYGGDMQALVHLFDRLRKVRPDLFINATTGTWPSPYWLFHSDTVWRGGGDTGYRGEGSRRQQWITYRDWLGYGIRTRRGPLFPFNSLKFQSVMCARLSLAAELGADLRDLTDDIRMAAASGTQLQEFFVTPALPGRSSGGFAPFAEPLERSPRED
ncbi:MAG: hypothetical protein MUF54_03335, partial [Polyangiaceae bacterium]|nr:hypothetical protein [Polyangiaceae bacterium]